MKKQKLINFDWLVYSHVNKVGIFFSSTTSYKQYVFYWNPITMVKHWLKFGVWFGWFPFKRSHLKRFIW